MKLQQQKSLLDAFAVKSLQRSNHNYAGGNWSIRLVDYKSEGKVFLL